ncbi:MAG: hypothetical protein H5U38_11090 [Calditrichaeota bacterium]|nr:hypothetical protein [Calditrichota bacterium]
MKWNFRLHLVWFLALVLGASCPGASGQTVRLESLSAWSSYVHGLGLKQDQHVRQATGWAAGGTASLRLSRLVAVGITAGYCDLTIEQDRAVEQWNWAFWQRFYGNYVRDLQSRDASYRATLTPDQHLYVTQVVPCITLRWPEGGVASFYLATGAGPWFYERALRLHEVWEKEFPELNHVFVYDYYNHAEVRKGAVYVATLEMGVEVVAQRFLHFRLSGRYGTVLPTGGSDYERFPATSMAQLTCALVFVY